MKEGQRGILAHRTVSASLVFVVRGAGSRKDIVVIELNFLNKLWAQVPPVGLVTLFGDLSSADVVGDVRVTWCRPIRLFRF